jgi:Ca-activated chloride channel family protein
MLLEEKVELWQERLGERATAGRAMTVWREAKRRCELRTMKDRRALARVILSRVRGIPARCELVQAMSGEPAVASYIRSKILASLTTPHRIALVMQHCDGAVLVGPEELEEVLAKAKSTEAKIKAVKALMALYPLDMELELTLLDLLEEEGSEERLAEAMRLARELRHAPYADERVRTRVGEFYMRNDREEEARRTFSEIVEFAPFSPGARRRLGDLYRNYGWSEDAYRQFETLWSMVPEDESTLILMAEAAADAGRTDEALRLAERVSQSGAHSGITADVARLFNAIRLARLRVAARAEGDEGKLKELMKRSRRAGVLRETPDLSVVLAWDHPDVKMKLFARYRGSEVQRAPMVAPHFGCEALHESESSGEVLVQVERDAESVRRETRGRLVVIWYAGTAEETVQVIDVVLDGEVGRKGELPSKAWLLSPPPGEAEPTEPLEFDLLAL